MAIYRAYRLRNRRHAMSGPARARRVPKCDGVLRKGNSWCGWGRRGAGARRLVAKGGSARGFERESFWALACFRFQVPPLLPATLALRFAVVRRELLCHVPDSRVRVVKKQQTAIRCMHSTMTRLVQRAVRGKKGTKTAIAKRVRGCDGSGRSRRLLPTTQTTQRPD